jgi:hypothetical protein
LNAFPIDNVTLGDALSNFLFDLLSYNLRPEQVLSDSLRDNSGLALVRNITPPQAQCVNDVPGEIRNERARRPHLRHTVVLNEVLQLMRERHRETHLFRASASVQVDKRIKHALAVNQEAFRDVLRQVPPKRAASSEVGVETSIRRPLFVLEGLPILVVEKTQQTGLGKLVPKRGQDTLSRYFPVASDGGVCRFDLKGG